MGELCSRQITSRKLCGIYNHETNCNRGAELVCLGSAIGTLRRGRVYSQREAWLIAVQPLLECFQYKGAQYLVKQLIPVWDNSLILRKLKSITCPYPSVPNKPLCFGM